MSNALHITFDCANSKRDAFARLPSRLVLATTLLASSLAFIDGSVVNVGLPATGRSFHAHATGLVGRCLPGDARLVSVIWPSIFARRSIYPAHRDGHPFHRAGAGGAKSSAMAASTSLGVA